MRHVTHERKLKVDPAKLIDLPAFIDFAADQGCDGVELTAYYCRRGDSAVEPLQVQGLLRDRLPGYMVPSYLIELEKMPMLPSDKVDRKRLPTPARSRDDLDAAYVEPRTPEERFLAELFTEVLGLDRIGMNDNFFDLGGASNQAVEVIRRASEAGYALTPG